MDHLHEVGVVVGDVGHGMGSRPKVISVGSGVADEESVRLQGAHHAVRRHAQEPGALRHLVDGPLSMVHVEQAKDG